jgi:peptide deformylase
VQVERPSSATLKATDLEGRTIEVQSDAFPARVWQHEFDHLNGVLIIDRIPADERKALRQRFKAATALGGRIG